MDFGGNLSAVVQEYSHDCDGLASGVGLSTSPDAKHVDGLQSDSQGSDVLVTGDSPAIKQVFRRELQVPGPTALDSEGVLDSGELDNWCQGLDGYGDVELPHSDDPATTVLDTGFCSRLAPQPEGLDWLLNLGERSDTGPDLCTEQLAPDVQVGSVRVDSSLPGFGVDHSRWSLAANVPKFFWEIDPFLSEIFGQSSEKGPDLKRPAVDVDLTVCPPADVMSLLQKPKQAKFSGLCDQVIKHVELRDETDKRQSVISNWTSLVCINLEAFAVGDAILAGGRSLTHKDVEVSLQACFARKATATLTKRFYALNRFVNFCGQRGLQFFPLREHVVFTFLQSMLHDEGTAASAGRSFLEACRFARGILGLRGDMAELGTARIDGVAVELSKRAAPLAQAAALLVSQVIALERLVATTDDMKDRTLFGAMLILLYGCGRFSDGQRAVNIILDVDIESIDPNVMECPGYVELQVLGNKGARSDVLRRTYLPVVAPIFSLGSVDWFRAWLQARETLGLEVNGKLSKPLMCRFNAEGQALQQEVTSSECGKLLRRALRVDQDASSGIRSHSLKATALSWAGKHGISLETRRLLGHHLDANAKSAEAYNRDSMGSAVARLVGTLQAIKQGLFLPDASRSGRFVSTSGTEIPATNQDTAQDETDSDSSFVPSSSDSSDSDDCLFSGPADSTLLWHLVNPGLRPGFVDVPETCTVFRNNASGMQHLKLNGSIKFLCGRRECNRYTYYAGKPVKGVAMCEHCLGSKDLMS